MNLKPAKFILRSFCYTRYEFQAPPISCVGVVSVPTTHGQKSAVYTSGLTATASDRRLSTASNVGFVEQKSWCAYKPRIKSEALTALEWW